jgi:DNA-binding response OmpR family regulator
MNLYIAIEKDRESFEFYKQLWENRNVHGIHASTMSDGIKKAIEIERSDDELYFISIVADDIDFMPLLKTLSKETKSPILIATSKENYSVEKHHEALRLGADFYAPFCDEPIADIYGVESVVESIRQRTEKLTVSQNIVAHGRLLIDFENHKAFLDDVEFEIFANELNILYYLMLNHGTVVRYKALAMRVYGEYTSNSRLYNAVKRLRKKIPHGYIETVKDIGYRFVGV